MAGQEKEEQIVADLQGVASTMIRSQTKRHAGILAGAGYLFIAQLPILVHGDDMVQKVEVPVIATMLVLSYMSDGGEGGKRFWLALHRRLDGVDAGWHL